jgi:hypothetical protein
MTRALLWACALLLAANLTREGARAFSTTEAGRIATALEQIARELPRIRQAQESNARHCTPRP